MISLIDSYLEQDKVIGKEKEKFSNQLIVIAGGTLTVFVAIHGSGDLLKSIDPPNQLSVLH